MAITSHVVPIAEDHTAAVETDDRLLGEVILVDETNYFDDSPAVTIAAGNEGARTTAGIAERWRVTAETATTDVLMGLSPSGLILPAKRGRPGRCT